MSLAIRAAEHGILPDALIRMGIRRLLSSRLADLEDPDCEQQLERQRRFVDHLRRSPVAEAVDVANEQHYELPPKFFEQVLGPHLKYSACWWPEGVEDLASAEEATLALTCQRAGLVDGMDILELGCGWGSLSLWMAQKLRRSRITAVSNSSLQRDFIMSRARQRGLDNLEVITADMNSFDPGDVFDRIVSLEMFEHMQNWHELFRRVSGWLKPEGRLFMHVFCHRQFAYPFVVEGASDWMARYFFTGGLMPSDDLPYRCHHDLAVLDHWRLDGRHYQRTLEAWLDRMDHSRGRIMPTLREAYGDDATLWWQRWRMFFMACSELFGYRQGQEWFVSHYLLGPRATAASHPKVETPHPTAETPSVVSIEDHRQRGRG